MQLRLGENDCRIRIDRHEFLDLLESGSLCDSIPVPGNLELSILVKVVTAFDQSWSNEVDCEFKVTSESLKNIQTAVLERSKVKSSYGTKVLIRANVVQNYEAFLEVDCFEKKDS